MPCQESRLQFFDSVTSNHVTVSYVSLVYTYNHDGCEASWKLQTEKSIEETKWALLAQACVSWPIRAVVETGGGIQQCVRKLMCFWTTEACKPILVVTQTKIMSLTMNTTSPLKTATVAPSSIFASASPSLLPFAWFHAQFLSLLPFFSHYFLHNEIRPLVHHGVSLKIKKKEKSNQTGIPHHCFGWFPLYLSVFSSPES